MTDQPQTLRQTLNEAMKDAMRAKDAARLGALRMVLAAIKDRDIAARTADSREGISESDVIAVMQKMVKQRREAADAFDQGGRPELAASERAEIAVIESYLPRQMDEAAIIEAVKAAIAELGAREMKDMGKVIALLRDRHAGMMDMSKVSPIVKSQLAG
jgi:uncharacterized protein YqeY